MEKIKEFTSEREGKDRNYLPQFKWVLFWSHSEFRPWTNTLLRQICWHHEEEPPTSTTETGLDLISPMLQWIIFLLGLGFPWQWMCLTCSHCRYSAQIAFCTGWVQRNRGFPHCTSQTRPCKHWLGNAILYRVCFRAKIREKGWSKDWGKKDGKSNPLSVPYTS